MKKLFYLFLALPLFFVACGDDDDDDVNGSRTPGSEVVIKLSEVLKGGLPKTVDDWKMNYGADGYLNSMDDVNTPNVKVSFTYADNVKIKVKNETVYDVVMNYESGREKYKFNMILGKDGYVSSCKQEYIEGYNKGEVTIWTFGYNNDGQLNKVTCKGPENDYGINMTYKDGNLVHLKITWNDEGESYEKTVFYTSETDKDGIDNKGCVMVFGELYQIDLEELEYAYYAGLLGKATKKLPLQFKGIDEEDGSEYTVDCKWTFNDKGLPISVHPSDVKYLSTFTW